MIRCWLLGGTTTAWLLLVVLVANVATILTVTVAVAVGSAVGAIVRYTSTHDHNGHNKPPPLY